MSSRAVDFDGHLVSGDTCFRLEDFSRERRETELERRSSPSCLQGVPSQTKYAHSRYCRLARKSAPSPSITAFNQSIAAQENGSQHPSAYHQYKRLDSKACQIRLIQVVPTSDALLCCKTIQCDFNEDLPAFFALSYVWGPPHPANYIVLDGAIKTVRRNLWLYLYNAQYTHPRTWLWIDALCIDQGHDEERQHQVRLMGKIYSSAQEVLVWLGADDYHLERLFELVLSDQLSDYGDPITQYCCRGLLVFHIYHECDIDYLTYNEILRGTTKLDNHPYWNRTWVVQEFELAKKRTFMFGKMQLSQDIICQVLSLQQRWARGLQASWPFYRIMRASTPDNEAENTFRRYLITYIEEFHRTSCEIPRDHVYAVLGLLKDASNYPIDYGSSDLEALVNAMAFGLYEIAVELAGAPCLLDSVLSTAANLAAVLQMEPNSLATTSRAAIFLPPLEESVLWALPSDVWQLLAPGEVFWARGKSPLPHGLDKGAKLEVPRCFATHFDPQDLLYYNADESVVLVMRKTPSTYLVVGRLSTSRYEVISREHDRKDHVLLCERYGSEGLGKTTFEPSMDEGVAEHGAMLGHLRISDLRSAIVLLGLPMCQNMRQEAIALLSRISYDNINLQNITFSSHDGKESVDRWRHEQDPKRPRSRLRDTIGNVTNPLGTTFLGLRESTKLPSTGFLLLWSMSSDFLRHPVDPT